MDGLSVVAVSLYVCGFAGGIAAVTSTGYLLLVSRGVFCGALAQVVSVSGRTDRLLEGNAKISRNTAFSRWICSYLSGTLHSCSNCCARAVGTVTTGEAGEDVCFQKPKCSL